MAIGIVGRKCGMTRVFNDEGASIPVTVVEVEPNRITQIKTDEADGYTAVLVTVGARLVSVSLRLGILPKQVLRQVVAVGNCALIALMKI